MRNSGSFVLSAATIPETIGEIGSMLLDEDLDWMHRFDCKGNNRFRFYWRSRAVKLRKRVSIIGRVSPLVVGVRVLCGDRSCASALAGINIDYWVFILSVSWTRFPARSKRTICVRLRMLAAIVIIQRERDFSREFLIRNKDLLW